MSPPSPDSTVVTTVVVAVVLVVVLRRWRQEHRQRLGDPFDPGHRAVAAVLASMTTTHGRVLVHEHVTIEAPPRVRERLRRPEEVARLGRGIMWRVVPPLLVRAVTTRSVPVRPRLRLEVTAGPVLRVEVSPRSTAAGRRS